MASAGVITRRAAATPAAPGNVSALSVYLAETPRRDFRVTATPGAGKTTFALTLAKGLLHKRVIDRVIVVAPTDHLRTQWADAADQIGVALDAQGDVERDRPGAP